MTLKVILCTVVSTNDEYTLSLVFNKYKNNDEDYEIVLEKYIKKVARKV